MSQTLDTSKMLVVQTHDGQWRYIDHTLRLLTMGFSSREKLEKGSDGFLDNPAARALMEKRYVEEWLNQPTVTEMIAARHQLNTSQAVAVQQLMQVLQPLQGPALKDGGGEEDAIDSDRDAGIRRVVYVALKELGVYDAGRCPLCLS